MFPVRAMCGHRCGFAMTATTAMPDAVLTGLAFNKGMSLFLCESGMAARISTIFGAEERWFFLQKSCLSYVYEFICILYLVEIDLLTPLVELDELSHDLRDASHLVESLIMRLGF
jgi:hypothetical protein